MVRSASEGDRFFTPDQADKTLPLVQQIVRDLVDLTESVELQRAQMEGIGALRQPLARPPYADEVQEVRKALEADRQRLEDCRRELQALGIRPHAPADGVIDFPAYLQRRPVVLCWQLGEPAVRHWHELDEPLEHRREIGDEIFDASEREERFSLPGPA